MSDTVAIGKDSTIKALAQRRSEYLSAEAESPLEKSQDTYTPARNNPLGLDPDSSFFQYLLKWRNYNAQQTPQRIFERWRDIMVLPNWTGKSDS